MARAWVARVLVLAGAAAVVIVLGLLVRLARRDSVLDDVERFHHARELTTSWAGGGAVPTQADANRSPLGQEQEIT